MSGRPLPMSPPVPPPVDINDIVSKYLPASAANHGAAAAVPATSSPPGTSGTASRTPSKDPFSPSPAEAANHDNDLPPVSRSSRPAVVDTPEASKTPGRFSGQVSDRYPAAYSTRSPYNEGRAGNGSSKFADPANPDEVLRTLRTKVEELEAYEDSYMSNVDVFRKQAEIDRREKSGLYSNVQKLRAQLISVEETKEAVEYEKERALQRRDEDCNRKILHMRKTLLMSEQSVGSLRTVNDQLAAKAAALDVQREECEILKRQLFQANQSLTLLAQQNDQLQRALKRKEADTQSDLDVYIKQLEVVQAQSAQLKKEMEVMTIKMREQENLQQEIEHLKLQNLDLQGAIQEVDKESAELQEKHNQTLQEKEEECAREVLNYRRELISMEQQIESLKTQNQTLLSAHRPKEIAEEINGLNARVDALTEELELKSRQSDALQRALARVEEERVNEEQGTKLTLDASQVRINTLTGELRSQQITNERLHEDVATLKLRLEESRADRNDLEAELHGRIRELQCQLDTITHRASTNQNEADTLKSLAAALEEKHRAAIEVLKAQHQGEIREALQRKDEQYAEIASDHVKQLEISSKLTAATRNDNANLSAEIAKLSSEVLELEPLRARVEQLEAQLAAREEEAANDLQTFNAQASSLTADINSLRDQREELRAELFDVKQELETLRRTSSTIPDLEQELGRTRNKVIEMNAEAIRTHKAHSQLVEDLQNQVLVLERHNQESLKNNSFGVKELELTVKNRQVAAENEKLRDLLKSMHPELNFSPLLAADAGPQQQPAPLEFSPVKEAPAQPAVRVPPLELSKALQSSASVSYLARGGSMYEPAKAEEVSPIAASHAAPATAHDEADVLFQGRDIEFGNQPQNSAHFETIPRLFEQTATLLGDSVAIRAEKRPGEWEEITWRQYYLKSFQFAKALVASDIHPFQGVVLCAANSAEWLHSYCGTIFAGALPVSCHSTWGPRHCFRIASECNAHVIVVDSGKVLQKFLALKDQLASVKHIVMFRESVPPALKSLHGDFVLSMEQFLARANHTTDESIALRGDNIMVEHAATVVYTCGTTGEPKGVVLSHDNLSFTAHSVLASLLQEQTMPTTVSFSSLGEAQAQVLDIILPMLYVCQRRSTFTVCFPRANSAVAGTLRSAKPSFVACSPAVAAEIAAEIAVAPRSEGDAKLAAWASKVSLDASRNRQDLVDIAPIKGVGMAQQVNERIRATLGLDRCTSIVVVGQVSLTVSEQLAQVGIDVLEAYGCAESTGFATVSTAFHYRFGTAGVRLSGADLRVDMAEGVPQRKEGELLIKGRNVMLGYLGHDDLTKRSIDAEGWYHTGDMGRLDDMNLLTVTGRIKELFTTMTGDKVSPQVIEAELKRHCPALSNVIVVGDRRKYIVALVTLKCKKNPETGAWTDDLAGDALNVNPEVTTVTTARRDKKWLDFIAQVVSTYNSQALSSQHKVRRFCILSSDISAEEMTPTKKVKRQLVMDRCINIIEKLYAEDSPRSSTK